MLEGCLLIGFAVIAVAFWLEFNDSIGWPNELEREQRLSSSQDSAQRDERYRLVRRRWRRVVHFTLAICGALMAAAGFAGPGPFWVAAWTAVAILMMTIILLAAVDAVRTHRHYASKLPKRNRQPPSGDLSKQ